jgi:hypothetical protein
MRGALPELAPMYCHTREEMLIAGYTRIWRVWRGQIWSLAGKPVHEPVEILLAALRFYPSFILLLFPHLDDMRV